MKASRLLSMLLLLQTHERMTTTELAARLEVSRRTVLRDVVDLAGAGVPVYAERGCHGGIVLLAGARLNAAHLDPLEIEALMLAGLDRDRLSQIGLGAAAEQAARKLAARRPPVSPSPGVPLADLVVMDNTGWMQVPDTVDVADLADALRGGQRLWLTYRRSGAPEAQTELIDPYGLAFASGRWYLVADVVREPRLFALARLRAYELVLQPWQHREGQDLDSVWSTLRAQVARRGEVRVLARLRSSRLDLAHRVLGSRLVDGGHREGDWSLITIYYDSVEAVRQLLQFGDHITVLEPLEARQRVHELAQSLAEQHSTTHAPTPPQASIALGARGSKASP